MTHEQIIAELVRIWHSPHLDLILKARLGEVIDALKEKNRSDSLVRDDAENCKESESKLDLISRQEVLDSLEESGYCYHFWIDIENVINSLPSAICDDCIWHVCNYNKIDWDGEDGYISRQDVVNEIHKYFVEEIDKTPTEIDEDGDELYADMPTVNSLLACNKELSKRIKSIPSAEAVHGEWIEVEVFPEVYDIEGVKAWGSEMQCDQCGFRHTAIEGHMAQYNFCPNCGARMTI